MDIMSVLRIRSATINDAQSIADLWRACNLVMPYNDPETDFTRAHAKENSDILVAVTREDKIVGSVLVGHDGHRGWIWYVASHPAHRTQGIGRAMIKAAEDWLRLKGLPKVMLLIRDTNRNVENFYRRNDYETVPQTVMQKWLVPADPS